MSHKKNSYSDLYEELSIDCKNCSGLCCVALYCSKSEGFPADKVSGKPCQNLMQDFRCSIHEDLVQSKMKGCLAYDCFGAGQKVTQNIYLGENWMTSPELAKQVYDVFLIVFQLHQMLWYLVEVSIIEHVKIAENKSLLHDVDTLIVQNEQMTQLPPEQILKLDIEHYRAEVNKVLKEVSVLIAVDAKTTRKSTDFFGKNFKRDNLDGKDFSMSLLIAANLEGCSLKETNFLGSDMRDTNIKNTDLSKSIFLTQMQVNAAIGNCNTKLPQRLRYPMAWKK